MEQTLPSPILSNSRIRIAVSALFFLSGLCFSSWASRIPDIKERLQMSDGALGLLLLGMPLGTLLSLPISGYLVDRYGSKSIIIIGTLLYACFLPLLGLAPNLYMLGITVVIFGVGGNFLNISMNTQAAGTEQRYGRTIMASFHGLWSLAGFTGAGIGALMIGLQVKPLYHFIIIGGLALVILFFALKSLLPDNSRAKAQKFVLQKPEKALLRIGLIAFCGMMCEGCMFDWSGVYFKNIVMAENGMVAAGFTAFMSTMALVRFLSDRITNSIGTRKILIYSGMLIFIGLLIAILLPYLVPAMIGFFIVGAGVAAVIPLSFSSAGKSRQFSPGVAIALVATMGSFGFLLGPALIGFIAEALSLKVSFALIALMGLTISMIAFSGKPSQENTVTT